MFTPASAPTNPSIQGHLKTTQKQIGILNQSVKFIQS